MVSIPPDKIAEIRDRADITQVVGRYVQLTKRGRRYVGLCPFHSEKTPSFGVSREKNLYHCFGCQAGGDVIDFIMRIESLSFPEALERLAAEVGVELPKREESPQEKKRRTQRDRLLTVNELAATFWHRCLERVPEAMTYLTEERGLTPETIAKFKLGWAAPSWSMLADLFQKKNIRPEDALELGLVGRRKSDRSLYDKYRGRVVFPIEGRNGGIVGFGARRADWVDPEGAKYLNSSESALYRKSTVLYGLGPAKIDIRRRRQAWLVEGYLDVIALHQAGLPYAVAACGTALAKEHAEILRRMVDEVVTFYDGDQAGRAATYKAAQLLLAQGLRVRVVDLPQGEDPDSYVRTKGVESVEKLVDQAPSAVDFFVARARTSIAGGGIAAATRALDQVKPMILAIDDPLTRDVTLQGAAKALGLSAEVLRKHLGAKKKPTVKTPMKNRAEPQLALEQAVLRCAVEQPEKTFVALESGDGFDALKQTPIRKAFQRATQAWRAGRIWDGAQWMDALAEEGADEPTQRQLRRGLAEELPESEDAETVVKRLMERHVRARLEEVMQQMAQAAEVEQAELTRQTTELMKRLQRLTRK